MLRFLAEGPPTSPCVVRRSVPLVIAAALLTVSAWFAPQSHSAQKDSVTVCAGQCDYKTIQAAIDHPSTGAGDTIQVLDAIHTESGIVVTKSVKIIGASASGTIVQAHAEENAASDRVFTIAGGASVTLQTMTVRHGKVTGNLAQGGGILNHGTLKLDRVTLTANRAVGTDSSGGHAQGGGIYSDGSLTVINSTISGNGAHAGSGG